MKQNIKINAIDRESIFRTFLTGLLKYEARSCAVCNNYGIMIFVLDKQYLLSHKTVESLLGLFQEKSTPVDGRTAVEFSAPPLPEIWTPMIATGSGFFCHSPQKMWVHK